jgi:ribosomal protein S10
LEELVIYDGDMKSVKAQAFRSLPALKNLSIKYAPLNSEWNREQWQQVEDTLESLSIVGTPLNQIDVSTFGRLNRLDVSDNEITNFERGVFPQKAQFTELNISYNPVKHVQNGFLHGVEVSNHVLHLNGWEIESFDWNAVEGMQNLRVVDVTKNPKLTKLQVTDHKKLPTQLHRIVVGRSPNLKLDDEKGQIAQTIRERNITLVVEGQVACTCKMNWIHQIQQENPEWIEIHRSRAICSRQGSDAGSIPASFWKNPTVANFLKHINDDKTGWCKNKKP